jgi:hypothetical protein
VGSQLRRGTHGRKLCKSTIGSALLGVEPNIVILDRLQCNWATLVRTEAKAAASRSLQWERDGPKLGAKNNDNFHQATG